MYFYKVIQAPNFRELEKKVTHLLNDGWRCSGSIYHMGQQWLQPMITHRQPQPAAEKKSKPGGAIEGMMIVDQLT